MSRPVHWRLSGTAACGRDRRYQDTLTDMPYVITCPECQEVHAAHTVIVETKALHFELKLDSMEGNELDLAVWERFGITRPNIGPFSKEGDSAFRARVRRIAKL